MTIKVPYSPFRAILLGFLGMMLFGAMLLALPFSHRETVPFIDHLFTAVSAASTTGLSTVSTSGLYTGLGQFVLLVLMQVGGWGTMTVTSFFLIARQKPLPPTKERVLRASYALPEGFDLRKFLWGTVLFTLVLEVVGAGILWACFALEGRPEALWSAVFHAVSAFATAGFSLYDDSLVGFVGHPIVNLTIGGLALAGSVGFIVLVDIWRAVRHGARVTFTTKVILVSTVVLVVGGTALVFLTEASLRSLPWPQALLAAAFQVVSTTSTAGFNTVDVAAWSQGILFFLVLLMIVGASPSGTGGGVKTTTLTALAAVVFSLGRNRRTVTLLGNEIPLPRVLSAAATAFAYLVVLGLGTVALLLVEATSMGKALFEAASALGGVGLSNGLTGEASDAGKALLMLLMYLGRVGPLTFGFGLLGVGHPKPSPHRSDLAV